MSFDRDGLGTLLASHGRIARVVVADKAGSAPREQGAAMLVWPEGQTGTIGGGALEWEAAARARAALRDGTGRLDRFPLGPALGQCCGGQVTILTEIWDAPKLAGFDGDVVARPLPGGPADMPLSVRRQLQVARARGENPAITIDGGWIIEPLLRPARAVWIYGAGHVGRAIAEVLAPLPYLEVTLIDDAAQRFPENPIAGVAPFVAANPADAVTHAPGHAEHLVLTYSHALDLELCHRILSRDFNTAGLIGSATKWARFRKRLAGLGHGPDQIARIQCPIGNPGLGKHPQAIALGVAAKLLQPADYNAGRAVR